MKYTFNDSAKLELAEACRFYDFRKRGLGMEFVIEVGVGVAKILDSPSAWPEVDAGIRRYLLDRFPYALIYRPVDRRQIEIVSIFHLHRQPDSWRGNL